MVQVQHGLDTVSKSVAPQLEGLGVNYSVHVLTHSADTPGIAEAIASRAQDLGAHCIVMAHQPKSAITVRCNHATQQTNLALRREWQVACSHRKI